MSLSSLPPAPPPLLPPLLRILGTQWQMIVLFGGLEWEELRPSSEPITLSPCTALLGYSSVGPWKESMGSVLLG